MREGYKAEALAIGNRIRGVLAEFGIVVSRSDVALRRAIGDADLRALLPPGVVTVIDDLAEHRTQVLTRQSACDLRIQEHARQDAHCVRAQHIIGVEMQY